MPWAVAAAALAYCAWLGWHWLPLDYGAGEAAGFVSRLWDVRSALLQEHALPWWTPYYLSGSSYGLLHSQGLFLVPSLAFSAFFDLLTSVKLTALLAIFAGAVAIYFCALHFLKSEWAAALAAAAFLLHPAHLIRAAANEHLGISVFIPFVPLTWLFFARSLERRRFADVLCCALAVAATVWAHNKMGLVNLLFLAAYYVYWVLDGGAWRARLLLGAKTSALIGALSLAIGAFFVVPGLTEAQHSQLFSDEELVRWRQTYSFKSLFALVDRDGVVTRDAMQRVLDGVNRRGVRSPEEGDQAGQIVALQTESPEKYAGLVVLALLAAGMLANRRREHRSLFWFLVGAFLASIMFGYGASNVWQGNTATWRAVMRLEDMPAGAKLAAWLALLALGAFLVAFYRRKLPTAPRRAAAAAALAAFLLVPAYALVAWLPFFKEIRAPYVFYDVNAAFFSALLCGFFVTDVLRSRIPLIVGAIVLLILVDFWPYQQPTRDNGVPAHTLANMRAAFASLQSDRDYVKVYMISARELRVLAPVLSGKPLAYEAFYAWMAPKGTSYLNSQRPGEPALLNLLGVRYLIFEKESSDPRMVSAARALAMYRTLYPVHREDVDFVVFRNPGAQPYLAAFAQAARFEGDPAHSVWLSLALAGESWPLIHAGADAGNTFARTYRDGEPPAKPEQPGRVVPLRIESLTRASHGSIRATVSADSPSWLVINESYYPYWRASVGGRSVPLYRASTGLMSVRLPEGRQELALDYSPPFAYFIAQLVSAAALVAALLAVWLERRRAG
jgi:hypothetical protein